MGNLFWKGAVLFIGAVFCTRQVLRYWLNHQQGRSSPFRIPAVDTSEGRGWAMVWLSFATFAVGGLLFLLDSPWWHWIPGTYLPDELRMVGAVVSVLGANLTFQAQGRMGESWRVGTAFAERTALVTEGIYGYVRNPIYLGLLLTWWGYLLVLPSVLVLGGTFLLSLGLHLVVRSEEAFLLGRHGEAYLRYRAGTGRFLPRSWRPYRAD